jgi:hypothetical protein
LGGAIQQNTCVTNVRETDAAVPSQLSSALKDRPILFCELPPELGFALREEPYRLLRFTHTWDRIYTAQTTLPSLAVIEINPDPTKPHPKNGPSAPGCFLARIERSGKVASFQSRLKFVGAHPLGFESLEDLMAAVTGSSFAAQMAEGIRAWTGFAPLTAVAEKLIAFLWEKHREAFQQLARGLPGAISICEAQRQQDDAIGLAKAFFGLRTFVGASDEIHVQEEHAIGRDAATVPGFDLIAANLQGTFTFRRGEELLTIYNAHKGRIEELLGVDLVYVNATLGSVVMVQYKVLEAERNRRGSSDWIFRPDPQFHAEVARMRLPPLNQQPDDYRLHPGPFFFKFVRRKQQPTAEDTSLVLSLEHLQHVLASKEHVGPHGGVRFSYEALRGQYLRASDFIGLIRSGYIGTHRVESKWLEALLQEISARKRGLVLGWQRRA